MKELPDSVNFIPVRYGIIPLICQSLYIAGSNPKFKGEVVTTAAERNLTWHDVVIHRKDIEELNNHRGATVWFTGLSGSGKSTVADYVARILYERGARTAILDGDNIRQGLNSDLGFSPADRTENIRRIGEVDDRKPSLQRPASGECHEIY
jgi:Mrp family chromosome partitioning ATPase